MKYFIILLIASFVFFGCDANDAGDNNSVVNGNEDEDPQVADLCLGVDTSSTRPDPESPGTMITYTIIRNQTELQDIVNDLTARYILCDDIEIDPKSTFTKIEGEFRGTLEGNNRTISNLRIQALQDDHVGLFGKISAGGEVRDLTLSLAVGGDSTNPSISGTIYVGALAGENEGTITNVRVNGGYVKGTSNYVGGLVGYNHDDGTIEKSYATSNVEGEHADVGGLVGASNGEIAQSHATGSVTGDSSVGGLVGASNGEIAQSYATGTVTGTSYYIGGLVGYNHDDGTIEQSYATGSVTGNDHVGGLVGHNDISGTIEKSYATGNVTGNSNIGGLVGANGGGTITTSYFDAATTGQSDAGAQGVTAYHTYTDPVDGDDLVYTQANGTGDKIGQSNFPAWDFTDIWHWQEGQWPLLQFQTTMTTQ